MLARGAQWGWLPRSKPSTTTARTQSGGTSSCCALPSPPDVLTWLLLTVRIDRTFRLDLERAGVPRMIEGLGKVDFHALRVTYVSPLDLNGASAKTAMELARHSTVQLTMRVYARASQERLRGVVEQLGGMVGAPAIPTKPQRVLWI
jgi:integrase